MAAGLEVFNPDGSVSSSITTRLTRILGSMVLSGAGGTITHPGFSTGNPFVFPRVWNTDNIGTQPNFWLYPDRIDYSPHSQTVTVDYGVY